MRNVDVGGGGVNISETPLTEFLNRLPRQKRQIEFETERQIEFETERQIEFETELKSSSKRNAKSNSNRMSVEPPTLLKFSIFAAAAAGAPVAKIEDSRRRGVRRTLVSNSIWRPVSN